MIFMRSKVGTILRASGFALLWVWIITYMTFPGLFKDSVSFLSEQISFENTGKFLLFGLAIYIFDLWVHISYTTDMVEKNLLISGTLASTVLCVLMIPFAIDSDMNRIYPIVIIGLSMGCQKLVSIYFNEAASNCKAIKVLKLS
jgi:hypothetical protein